ncbi:MAG: hypothetical protein WCO55_01305 [Candidatus Falkowbacteria bacterium]
MYIHSYSSSISDVTGGRVTVREVTKENGQYFIRYAEPGFENSQSSWDEHGEFSPENQRKLKERFGNQMASREELDGRDFDDGDWHDDGSPRDGDEW